MVQRLVDLKNWRSERWGWPHPTPETVVRGNGCELEVLTCSRQQLHVHRHLRYGYIIKLSWKIDFHSSDWCNGGTAGLTQTQSENGAGPGWGRMSLQFPGQGFFWGFGFFFVLFTCFKLPSMPRAHRPVKKSRGAFQEHPTESKHRYSSAAPPNDRHAR